jgi:hypothetical protein
MADINDASDMSDASSVIILAQAEALDDHLPINPDFVLIDSQSMVDLFSNLNHVQNICPAHLPIKVHCNKGTISTVVVADFGNMEVYLDKDGIANVLSLFHLGQKYQITHDSCNRNGGFMAHTPCGVVEFHPTTNGLHIVDLKQNPEAAYLLVNDADIDDNAPQADSFPHHHTSTLYALFGRVVRGCSKELRSRVQTPCLAGLVRLLASQLVFCTQSTHVFPLCLPAATG